MKKSDVAKIVDSIREVDAAKYDRLVAGLKELSGKWTRESSLMVDSHDERVREMGRAKGECAGELMVFLMKNA